MQSIRGAMALGGFLALLWAAGLFVFSGVSAVRAKDGDMGVGPAVGVPFRLSLSKHLLVRARINGKGPFNFVLDTGAPAMFFTEKVAERAGVKQGEDGWGTCDGFELEGGLKIPKARAKIATPFQLEGMNGMGLAGAEIHGLIGYNILAQYRITFDLASDRLIWRRIDWEPKNPFGIVDKSASSSQGGLEMLGGMMKGIGGLLGRKANPTLVPRGYAGVILADSAPGTPARVDSVLPDSPAAKAGLHAGDVIIQVDGVVVSDANALLAKCASLKNGQELRLKLDRQGAPTDVTVRLEDGL